MTESELRKGLADKPFDAFANYLLGAFLSGQRRHDEATDYLFRATMIDRNNPRYSFGLANNLLMRGRYERGFFYYETQPRSLGTIGRWRYIEGMGAVKWNGEPLDGKVLVVTFEQGIGDTIQFSRSIPVVAETAGRVVVWCDTVTAPLMRCAKLPENVTVTTELEKDDVDFYCALDSLPRLTSMTVETIPTPLELTVTKKRWKLPEKKRVGLVWAGSPENPLDHIRSTSLEAFSPLFDVKGVTFVSLQQRAKGYHGMPIVDAISECATLVDTASLIEELDLVISVDTAVAHLAGTLGKPTWLLNRFASEWRWMCGRTDSPWYPSVTIFTQISPGGWRELLERVAVSLANL